MLANYAKKTIFTRGVDPGVCGILTPWKCVGFFLFWPPKNVTVFNSKLLLDNSASFTRSSMKRLVSIMEGKTNFSKRLQAVRNRDCWMLENHWRRTCNLKHFDSLTWSLVPPYLRHIYATDFHKHHYRGVWLSLHLTVCFSSQRLFASKNFARSAALAEVCALLGAILVLKCNCGSGMSASASAEILQLNPQKLHCNESCNHVYIWRAKRYSVFLRLTGYKPIVSSRLWFSVQ